MKAKDAQNGISKGADEKQAHEFKIGDRVRCSLHSSNIPSEGEITRITGQYAHLDGSVYGAHFGYLDRIEEQERDDEQKVTAKQVADFLREGFGKNLSEVARHLEATEPERKSMLSTNVVCLRWSV